MPLQPSRTVDELRELRELTGDENGAQRGSVADMPVYPGDVLTPGVAATKDAKRLAIKDAPTITKIPVMPISYADALPLFNSGRVRLLDNRRLVSQFAALERKTSAMGRDVINHPPGGHDDVCNAAAGALVSATAPDRRPRLLFG